MKSGKKLLAAAIALSMLGTTALPAFAASEISKDETVYVVTEADGSQSDVTVSDHLKNGSGSDKIQDESSLKDIENVKGDETFEAGDDNALTWKAGGNDIFYQGSTDKEVPVKLGISYFLDGDEVQGSELEGASGDVKIVIKYRNTSQDDHGTTIPFLAMTALIAEDDSFTDIDIDHGKVIDDGDKQIVAAIAVPGLEDALNLDSDLVDLDLSDTVTITGKAKDFAVQDMMTVVTNSIFEEIDSDDFGDLDYDSQINELNKGAKALVDGSDQLYKGIDTLYENMPTLKKGIGKLASGSKELSKGTDQALQGAQALDQGANQLSGTLTSTMGDMLSGVTQLKGGSDYVLNGAKQIKEKLDGNGTPKNPGAANALESVSADVSKQASEVRSAANKMQALKTSAGAVNSYLNDIDSSLSDEKDRKKIRDAGYGDLLDKLDSMRADAKAVSEGLSNVPGDLETAADSLDTDASNANNVATGISGVSAMLGSEEKTATLIGGLNTVDQGLGQIQKTLKDATGEDGDLSKGLASLTSGTSELKAGEVQLSGGAKQLADGMDQLQKKSGTLSSGVSKLDQGSLKLSQGMSELYNKGIRKIVDLYNNELKGSMDDLEEVLDAGQSYQSFTNLPKGMDGSVKFIYKTTVY